MVDERFQRTDDGYVDEYKGPPTENRVVPPQTEEEREEHANADPLTGAPGAHPLGVGLGATGAGVAGGVIAAAGGPLGAAVGVAVGALIGGLAGKAVAEAVDPTSEVDYWQTNFRSRPYVEPDDEFESFGPAYRAGYVASATRPGEPFEQVEPHLEREWQESGGAARLEWVRARQAARDAYVRGAERHAEDRRLRPGE